MSLQVVQNNNEEYSLDIPFSTTEHRIGTWIDGKPLYRKTFVTTTQLAGEVLQFFDNNIDKIWINLSESFITANKNTAQASVVYYPLIYFTNLNGSYVRTNLQVKYNSPNWKYFVYMNSNYGDDFNGKTVYITIEYTRTTD